MSPKSFNDISIGDIVLVKGKPHLYAYRYGLLTYAPQEDLIGTLAKVVSFKLPFVRLTNSEWVFAVMIQDIEPVFQI